MKQIKYPTFTVKGRPTPNVLWVCDSCRHAEWSTEVTGHPPVCHKTHLHANEKNARMRKATAEEKAAGEAALETII